MRACWLRYDIGNSGDGLGPTQQGSPPRLIPPHTINDVPLYSNWWRVMTASPVLVRSRQHAAQRVIKMWKSPGDSRDGTAIPQVDEHPLDIIWLTSTHGQALCDLKTSQSQRWQL